MTLNNYVQDQTQGHHVTISDDLCNIYRGNFPDISLSGVFILLEHPVWAFYVKRVMLL